MLAGGTLRGVLRHPDPPLSDGEITLRAVEFAYPRGGVYEDGDDAELRMAIINDSEEADALVDISGEGFGDVEIDDDTAVLLSHEIAREIEEQLEYPGQIKVTVIRESRAIEFAK